MSDDNQLQNDEYYIPGNLGSISILDKEHEIVKVEVNTKDKYVSLTLQPPKEEGVQEILIAKGFQMISYKTT